MPRKKGPNWLGRTSSSSLVIDATDKIYFEDKNEYVVVSSKITVDFLNKLCNTVKTNLQETKMNLKLNKIEEDFE